MAEILTGKAPGGERQKLSKILPLDTPLVVQIFPIYLCNCKCSYCIFQYPKEERHFISDKIKMNINLYKKCVDDALKFKSKIKTWRIVGVGEPLLWKHLSEAILYTKEKNIAERIEVISNGVLLNKEIADELIDSGLDRLVISLQGLSSKKYKEISKVDIDFNEFVYNIKYFYKNKKNTHLYLKVVDTALEENEEKKFYELFGDKCDSMAIEQTVPIHVRNAGLKEKDKTQFGLPVKEVKICPQPFHFMEIRPDGNITGCYNFKIPAILGNVEDISLVDIWNGDIFNSFRRSMLEYSKNIFPVCKSCTMYKYRAFDEDNLDKDTERLKEFYDE